MGKDSYAEGTHRAFVPLSCIAYASAGYICHFAASITCASWLGKISLCNMQEPKLWTASTPDHCPDSYFLGHTVFNLRNVLVHLPILHRMHIPFEVAVFFCGTVLISLIGDAKKGANLFKVHNYYPAST